MLTHCVGSTEELQHLVVLLLTQVSRPTNVSIILIFGYPSDRAIRVEAVQTKVEDKSLKQDTCKRACRYIAFEKSCCSADTILMDVETTKDLDHL